LRVPVNEIMAMLAQRNPIPLVVQQAVNPATRMMNLRSLSSVAPLALAVHNEPRLARLPVFVQFRTALFADFVHAGNPGLYSRNTTAMRRDASRSDFNGCHTTTPEMSSLTAKESAVVRTIFGSGS